MSAFDDVEEPGTSQEAFASIPHHGELALSNNRRDEYERAEQRALTTLPSGGGDLVQRNTFELNKGNYQGSRIGNDTYNNNLQKTVDYSGAKFSTTNTIVHHYGSDHQATGTAVASKRVHGSEICIARKKARHADDDNNDLVDLSCSISIYRKKSLCTHRSIYQGIHRSSLVEQPVAVKIIPCDPFNNKNLREAKILLKLSPHQNVVSFVHTETCHNDINMYIAMELCSEKNLYCYINDQSIPFAPHRSIEWSHQVVEALDHIHKNGIIHGDLKPDNILLSIDQSTVKIADFGLSKEMISGRSVTNRSTARAGTDGYRAPETYTSNLMSKKGDIFSLGLVAFFLWSGGKHPYGDDPDDWNSNIKRKKGDKSRNLRQLLIPKKKHFIGLLKWMLEYCPEARPSTHDILEAWDFKEQEETIEKGVLEPITDIEPLRAEIVEEDSTTLVVFTNRGLLSWRFGGGQTEILGEFDSILNGNLCTFSAVAVGETLYVLRWDKAVFKLNPFEENSTWNRVADTKLGHGANPAAVAFEDSMVVCGGGWEQGGLHRLRNWRKLKTSSECELYRSDTNQWKEFPYLNKKRRLNTVIESNGYIYCIGGIGDSPSTWNWQSEEVLKSVEKYDPDKKLWVCIAPMTLPRCSPAAAEHDGLLYVLGGGGAGVECYHPNSNVWTMLTQSLTQPRIKFRAVIQDRKLYAVGGERTQSIEMVDLDAEEDDREWKMVYQLDGFQLESMGTVVMQPY